MTDVRIATRADEPQLMDMIRGVHRESGLFALDDDMARTMLERAFARQGGLIGVIDGKKEIEACIFLLISNFWYSRDNHLEELFNFVRPEYRKSNHASAMLSFAKKCSDQIGIPLVIGVLTNLRMEAKVRLYRQKIGIPAGAFFVYGGKWINDSVMSNGDLWKVHSRKRKEIIAAVTPSTMTTSAVPMLTNGGG